MDTLVNTGAYFNSGGAETFKEWVQSPMYVFVWPKDGGSISDRVTLRLQKDTSADPYGIRGATDRQGTQADQGPYQGQKTSVILMTRHRGGVRVSVSGNRVIDTEVSRFPVSVS